MKTNPERAYYGKANPDLPLFSSSLPSGDKTTPSRYEAGMGAAGEGGGTRPSPEVLKTYYSPEAKATLNKLFPPKAHARRADKATSHAAAASVRGISKTQKNILRLLQHSPLTDEGIAQQYDHFRETQTWRHDYFERVSPSGLRSRRKELCDMGLVEDSGATAKISTGRRAIVWRLVK